MYNNCTCRHCNEKFLLVFQEIKAGQWQLIESWMAIWRKGITPQEDNLGQNKDIWTSLTVSSHYKGCPFCKAKGIFICGNCHTVNCCDENDATVVGCAACQIDGELTPIEQAETEQDQ